MALLDPLSGGPRILRAKATLPLVLTTLLSLIAAVAGCSSIIERQDVRPLVMRDVPAQRLAYRFEPDVALPNELQADESNQKLAAIQTDFTTRRPDDALLRTVVSPDGQRALALYGTEDDPGPSFRIDLYSADGKFLRNLTPPDLACVFPETVSWSSEGTLVAFIAHKNVKPSPSPTPPGRVAPEPEPSPGEAAPSPTIAPAFAAVATFNTEQIYVCNRDGYDLKPLTTREGLIYFYFKWAPDNHALVALACKEPEWDAREKGFKLPAGRARLIALDGKERLLDDALTDCLPIWSPDSSKVATAFEFDVAVFDAATNKPTQARIPLHDALIAASLAFAEKTSGSKRKNGEKDEKATGPPASFNPIVRLDWPKPETIYMQTAFVRVYPNETINTFQRWHRLNLSPQAAVLK
ncbi:MAG: hypothetical protein ABI967_01380 [bacterium]